MLQFLLRRLTVAALVAVTVVTLAFVLTRLSGDLAISIAGPNAHANRRRGWYTGPMASTAHASEPIVCFRLGSAVR